VYLENQHGSATIDRWTMSRLNIRLSATGSDDLIVNQNFHRGWYARRARASGSSEALPALRSPDGLIAIPVDRGHTDVEVYYEPPWLLAGLWMSAAGVVVCQILVRIGRMRAARH
ncbi:MAG: hypothetical protein ACRD2N_23240, partial [Vicinamibacterales bacterium]